jgi:hypothetical protein
LLPGRPSLRVVMRSTALKRSISWMLGWARTWSIR